MLTVHVLNADFLSASTKFAQPPYPTMPFHDGHDSEGEHKIMEGGSQIGEDGEQTRSQEISKGLHASCSNSDNALRTSAGYYEVSEKRTDNAPNMCTPPLLSQA
jgi:hypothetical protein